nr:uncharacterized protein LOC109215991 [Ipomoea batatas]
MNNCGPSQPTIDRAERNRKDREKYARNVAQRESRNLKRRLALHASAKEKEKRLSDARGANHSNAIPDRLQGADRMDKDITDEFSIILRSNISMDQRTYNMPSASQVAAIWIEDNGDGLDGNRNIRVHANSGIQRVSSREHVGTTGSRQSANINPNNINSIDELIQAEECVFTEGRKRASVSCATVGADVGRRVILPVSFIGGPRDMRRRYMDAMSFVQRFGKPDLFITVTCNPNWPEIKELLKYVDEPQNRPDLLARVFHARLEELKNDIFKRHIFGEVAAYAYVIDFKKGDFHMLTF